MNYLNFEEKLLKEIKDNNKNCISTLESNIKLIQSHLQNKENYLNIQKFVININNIILTTSNNYSLIENILKHDCCQDILNEFRESDILIEACKIENIPAVKWLLTMSINYCTQDDDGRTALMYAAHHSTLAFVVENIIKNDVDCIHILDKNGENALFHAVHSKENFLKLVYTDIDINIQNKQMDTVFLYCCKHDLEEPMDILIKMFRSNFDITDKNGKTPSMYLVEHGNIKFLNYLLRKKFDINYRNKLTNETLLSIFLKKYREIYTKNCNKTIISYYTQALMAIIDYPSCDLNSPIDEIGNTPIMLFMMIQDIPTVGYILSNYENLDLSIKNINGVSASLLVPYFNKKEFYIIKAIIEHPTFDAEVVDSHNNNILIHSILCDNESVFSLFINKYPDSINQINDKNENALIIAIKTGFDLNFKEYNLKNCNINQQDYLGNTALHYAVMLKDFYSINMLFYNNADYNIKNEQHQSVLDLINDIDDQKENIIKIMKNPISLLEMKKKMKKGTKRILFNKKKSANKINDEIEINNYKENYKVITEKFLTYPKSNILLPIMENEAIIYHEFSKSNKIQIPLSCVNVESSNGAIVAAAVFIMVF